MSLGTGDRVRVAAGPFTDFLGIVTEINLEASTVKVVVSFFGRQTPIELDFGQVERV